VLGLIREVELGRCSMVSKILRDEEFVRKFSG